MVNRVNEWRRWQGKEMKEIDIPLAHEPGVARRVSEKSAIKALDCEPEPDKALQCGDPPFTSLLSRTKPFA